MNIIFPATLLVGYFIVCVMRTPQIADSLIMIILSLLYGAAVYLKEHKIEKIAENSDLAEMQDQIRHFNTKREVLTAELELNRVADLEKGRKNVDKRQIQF